MITFRLRISPSSEAASSQPHHDHAVHHRIGVALVDVVVVHVRLVVIDVVVVVVVVHVGHHQGGDVEDAQKKGNKLECVHLNVS